MVLGLDTSHYPAPGQSSAVPSQAAIDCAWSQGYRFWIVGLQQSGVFVPTIRRLAEDGRFRIEVYSYLYQSMGPESQVRKSIAALQDAGLLKSVKRFWLDYEHGAELPGDAEVAQIKHLANVCNSYGVEAGWYSGNWWTQGNISPGGLKQLAGIPYWIAYYVGGPNPISGQPVHTKQYQGTTTVCGTLNTDLNWRPDEIWAAEQGDDDMDAEGLIALVQGMNDDQRNRFYKHAFKHAKIDIEGKPADAPIPLTEDSWNHYLKDKLAELEARDDSGGSVDPDDLKRIIGKALQDAGASLNP